MLSSEGMIKIVFDDNSFCRTKMAQWMTHFDSYRAEIDLRDVGVTFGNRLSSALICIL